MLNIIFYVVTTEIVNFSEKKIIFIHHKDDDLLVFYIFTSFIFLIDVVVRNVSHLDPMILYATAGVGSMPTGLWHLLPSSLSPLRTQSSLPSSCPGSCVGYLSWSMSSGVNTRYVHQFNIFASDNLLLTHEFFRQF